MQRRRGLAAVMIIGVLLSGCTPVAEETPPPTVVTPTGTPTLAWTEDEQAAIDAVQRYLEVWTEISQNPQGGGWDRIRDVASDPAANDAVDLWSSWVDDNLHLVGGPVFTVDWVTPGMMDYLGNRFHVHGCYSTENGYLSDPQGNPVGNKGVERIPNEYLVILMNNGQHLVLESTAAEGTC